MHNKTFRTGFILVAVAAIGIMIAVVMEVHTGEPIYYLIMKITCGFFGVGGAMMGLSTRGKRKK
ncbi:unnamed protein product [marine sediment metagenome]|uniref:Uncharacterized protein n=1 Tax=marine sediment metagenome TaxID=412755 RepID=X1QPM0_9ZZZZ